MIEMLNDCCIFKYVWQRSCLY